MIEARGLTKRYGDKVAVDNISFTVEPGTVTGFLGPNGAGKSTTMRMIMGLDKPTTGTVTVAGKKYKDLNAPLCTVGALLDAKGLHGSQTARTHLTQLAVSNGIPVNRVDKVLDMTGLTSVAKKRVKGFSLGMGQRLGIAAAHGIVLHELTTIKASLEDAYLELTGGNTEYNTTIPRGQADQPVTQQHALR